MEDSGLEQSYTPDAVNKRLQIEFAKLQKLLVSQFESKKPVSDIVRENEKYYGLNDLRLEEEFAKLQKLLISQLLQWF